MNDISLTGSMVVVSLLVLAAIVIGLIFFFRQYYRSKSEGLTAKYADASWSSPLEARANVGSVSIVGLC